MFQKSLMQDLVMPDLKRTSSPTKLKLICPKSKLTADMNAINQLPSSISSAHQPQLLRLQPIEDFKLQRDSASDSFTHLNVTSIKRCEMKV
nr:hypothetical protein CFP56_37959 [Quercus suber]